MPDPRNVQQFLANGFGIGAIRRMGPPGTLARVKGFLRDIDLTDAPDQPSNYIAHLNDLTAHFILAMPEGGKHWGMARKCLNLFFRDALYNFYLRDAYDLQRFENDMEIPLDSYVGEALSSDDRNLPRWPGVVNLSEADSAKFQAVAARIAVEKRTHRVHLDLVYWLPVSPSYVGATSTA